MPHLDQNETHRSHRSLAALHIVKEHRIGARSSSEDVIAERASAGHLRHLAGTDALTGLANYRRLSETLSLLAGSSAVLGAGPDCPIFV
jgi:PleD family two-component response regulator